MMTPLLLLAVLSAGDVYADTFRGAHDAYQAGDYAAAIDLYEQIVAESVASPVLFYNLGNAYYRDQKLGEAVANYERALQLDPGFEQARHNLDKAIRDSKQHLARPLPPEWEQSLLFWHYGIGRSATYALAALFWAAFWAALGVRQWRSFRYARTAIAVLGLLAVAFAVSAWNKSHPAPLAVARMEPTPVRYGTNDAETIRFNLSPGDRVNVDGREQGWARITTANGERGWTREENLVFVGPPYERPAGAKETAVK